MQNAPHAPFRCQILTATVVRSAATHSASSCPARASGRLMTTRLPLAGRTSQMPTRGASSVRRAPRTHASARPAVRAGVPGIVARDGAAARAAVRGGAESARRWACACLAGRASGWLCLSEASEARMVRARAKRARPRAAPSRAYDSRNARRVSSDGRRHKTEGGEAVAQGHVTGHACLWRTAGERRRAHRPQDRPVQGPAYQRGGLLCLR